MGVGGSGWLKCPYGICATCFPKCFRFFMENVKWRKAAYFLKVNQIELNNYEKVRLKVSNTIQQIKI